MRSASLRLAALAVFAVSSAAFAQTTTPEPAQAPQTAAPAGTDATAPQQQVTDSKVYVVDPNRKSTDPALPSNAIPVPPSSSSSMPDRQMPPEPPPTKAERRAARDARHSAFDDKYHFGVLAKIGTAGAGIELGIPVVPHLAIRAGGDFVRYTGTFQEDAATIAASLQFGYGRVSLDYFPWRHRRFHISPLLIVANQTHIQANVSIDPSQIFEIEGQQFRGSVTDPLHGVGRVDLNKTSGGLTVGFGNITHGRGHWTFPVEMGAFYNGQPKLQIDFTGTVCAVNQPPVLGCAKVQDQADFKARLQQFRDRQNHNLSYAKFIPVFNFGVGYRF